MKTSPLDLYKRQTNTNQRNQPRQENKNKNPLDNATLQGVLLNNYIKKRDNQADLCNFDRISSSLLIPEQQIQTQIQTAKEKEESFNYKKILKPIAITTGATLVSIIAISLCMRNYSKVMATKSDIVRPGDLARNFNILEEPHYAMYRALRDPNAKNILGLIGVGMFSALTLSAKNFTDGTKEVWIKKQTSDIERDLQENLIQVETDAFSGKLNVVNTLLKDTTEYFKGIFSSNKASETNFKNFLSFKGEEENKDNEEKNNKNIKAILLAGGGILGILGLSFALFKNYQKTVKNLDTFVQKFEDKEIKSKIANALKCDDKEKAIKQLTDILKVINAKDETMQTNLSKIKGITPDEIAAAIKDIKSAQIYAQAPEALGGVAEKIQYYCYINEERGHLYNWILNPENKFNKYLFLAFSAISAVGYVAKEVAEAIKEVAVSKENSKTELNLRKKLVQVEIENFKSKKLSAINPLIDNFIYQLEKGKPKEELKELAENILVEIKNGPPYVYS